MDKSLFFEHHRERPRKPKLCVFADVGSSLFVFAAVWLEESFAANGVT